MLLTARSGRVGHGERNHLAELRSVHSFVSVVACNGSEMCEACALLPTGLHVGLLNAAGVADRSLLMDLEAHRMLWMLSSKALGAWHTSVFVSRPLEVLLSY